MRNLIRDAEAWIAFVAIFALAFLIAWLGALLPREPQRIDVTVRMDRPIQVQLVPAK